MPDVVLAGAFGQRNPGDEALLRAFLGALPGNVTVTSRDPIATRAIFGCETISSRRRARRRGSRAAHGCRGRGRWDDLQDAPSGRAAATRTSCCATRCARRAARVRSASSS